MKNFITIIILVLLVLGCKEENNPLNKIKEVSQDISNVQNAAKTLSEAQEKTQELAKLEPVTKEVLKAWMPEKVGDLKRSSFNITKELGMMCKLVYKGEDKKKININIIDGAGTGAPMMTMFSVMQNMDIDNESDTGYERTQKFGNQNVYVKYNKTGNYEKSKLQCTINGRFGIEANAWEMTPEKLWEYIQLLEIEEIVN